MSPPARPSCNLAVNEGFSRPTLLEKSHLAPSQPVAIPTNGKTKTVVGFRTGSPCDVPPPGLSRFASP
jgi:hypothetical protein